MVLVTVRRALSTMKWLALLFLMLAVMSAMADDIDSRDGAPDYTSRYAELASPLPSHINVQDLLSSLAAASHLH
ncbi:hypothetical protein SFRURICE_016010 [Spodoptera frugiperda]|uniref:SFRICE_036857 n=1 Tax=Spodoptera frugiperda TaxID=7108 RepID=A0A2H1X1Q4_SPOFR|nr:hypothetical protein SFRURICE_016010 [Spodoptera frugiperda]